VSLTITRIIKRHAVSYTSYNPVTITHTVASSDGDRHRPPSMEIRPLDGDFERRNVSSASGYGVSLAGQNSNLSNSGAISGVGNPSQQRRLVTTLRTAQSRHRKNAVSACNHFRDLRHRPVQRGISAPNAGVVTAATAMASDWALAGASTTQAR